MQTLKKKCIFLSEATPIYRAAVGRIPLSTYLSSDMKMEGEVNDNDDNSGQHDPQIISKYGRQVIHFPSPAIDTVQNGPTPPRGGKGWES